MLTSGLGTIIQSQAASQQATAGEKSARFAARETKRRARYEATRYDEAARRVRGQQLQTFARAGVQLSETATDVLAKTAQQLTLDKIMALRNAQAEAYGQELAAEDYAQAARTARKGKGVGVLSSAVGIGAALLSDRRAKTNRRPLTGALDKVRRLTAYHYNYCGSDVECIGLMAQEVERELPAAVVTRDGMKMVQLYGLQSLLLAAIRELKAA
jgi:hypothetical protein